MGLNLLSGVASLPTFYYELSRHDCWTDALSRQAFLARLLVGVSWGAALQHALSRQACLRGCSPESHGMLPCSMLYRSKLAGTAACQSLMGCCLAACSVVAWLPARSPESHVMLRVAPCFVAASLPAWLLQAGATGRRAGAPADRGTPTGDEGAAAGRQRSAQRRLLRRASATFWLVHTRTGMAPLLHFLLNRLVLLFPPSWRKMER
ncbi:hypothetical protein ACQJBY_055898 [Aegilops geniculata]